MQSFYDKKEEFFTFANLIENKLEDWINVAEFYGISSEFPNENLFYQKNTKNNLVFVSEGLTQLMKYKRKYKINVVNIGVKMFSRNRDDKSRAKVKISSFKNPFQYRLL